MQEWLVDEVKWLSSWANLAVSLTIFRFFARVEMGPLISA
jgi:hypothetical protein